MGLGHRRVEGLYHERRWGQRSGISVLLTSWVVGLGIVLQRIRSGWSNAVTRSTHYLKHVVRDGVHESVEVHPRLPEGRLFNRPSSGFLES